MILELQFIKTSLQGQSYTIHRQKNKSRDLELLFIDRDTKLGQGPLTSSYNSDSQRNWEKRCMS